MSYSDDSGRSVIYDFSSGTVSNNAIQLPESSIISRDTGETGTTYIWGQVTGMSAISLSLDSVGKKATVGPVTEGEGVAILYADDTLPPQSTAPTWNYSLELSNFNFNTDVDGAYLFEIGLGRDEESGGSYNEAFVSVKWVKGYFDGDLYNTWTLIIEEAVENGETDYYSASVFYTSYTPSATTVKLNLTADANSHFSATYKINNGIETAIGDGWTLASQYGIYERLPNLYPFLFMEEENASTEPDAGVYTVHWQSGGNSGYNVNFSVDDPLHKASAVRVTNSVYLGDGVDLFWDENNKSWHSGEGYPLGSAVTPYPSFIFKFTPQTGEASIADQQKSVTGYVEEFATNLQPSGSISTNPVFTWTGITGAAGYGVEVFDQTGFIWANYGIPPNPDNTYSFAYRGPSLTNGETYLYNIASQIEQGDFWNTSINQGSFTYTGSGIVGTGGVNLLLVSTGHPPIGFNFVTGQVISAMDDPAVNFMITGFSGNEAPYSAYGWLSQGTALKDMGLMTPEAFDLLESAPTEGYSVPEYINLTEGHAYAFMLGNGTKGMIVVRSVTVDGTTVTMTFDYKYFGSGAGGDTISYNGKLMTAPNWPGNDGMQPVPSAPVWAVNETGLLRQVQRPFLTAVFRSPGFRHQPASGWMFLPHLQVLCRYGADGTIGTPTLLLNYPLFCSRRHSMKHLATLPVQV